MVKKSLYVLKKGEKLTVRESFQKNFPFLDKNSLDHIHKQFKKGTTRTLIQKHIWEKYQDELEVNIGTKRGVGKKMDNILWTLEGKKGLDKKVIHRSKKKYLDPLNGINKKVLWYSHDKKTAEKAGKIYETRIKKMTPGEKMKV